MCNFFRSSFVWASKLSCLGVRNENWPPTCDVLFLEPFDKNITRTALFGFGRSQNVPDWKDSIRLLALVTIIEIQCSVEIFRFFFSLVLSVTLGRSFQQTFAIFCPFISINLSLKVHFNKELSLGALKSKTWRTSFCLNPDLPCLGTTVHSWKTLSSFRLKKTWRTCQKGRSCKKRSEKQQCLLASAPYKDMLKKTTQMNVQGCNNTGSTCQCPTLQCPAWPWKEECRCGRAGKEV